ncbi:MAG: YihY/virulence factor BrkB family protein [Chitinophagaceae bacterium]|nr:YihY/virulence factor BrkB family protein [Chitinophagaceae bacterium]
MLKLERIILNTPVSRLFIKKSKKWILPGFEGVPLYEVMRFFWKQLRMSGLTERASAISYNFIMSIPPTCLFLFTLIPNLSFIPKKTIRTQLNSLIVDIVPSKTYNAGLISFVDSFLKGPQIGLISFGFVLSLFFASNAMMGVMRSFDKDYIGFEKRKGLHKRWIALKLTSLLFSLLLICLLLLISQGQILNFLGIKNIVMKDTILYGKWVVIMLLIFWSFAIIYKYAPATQKRWKFISPGAIIATFLSILATFAFASFVNNFGRYNILYGSIGTIIVVMSLIFINSLVVLIGFEFNVSIKSLRSMAESRKKQEALSAVR